MARKTTERVRMPGERGKAPMPEPSAREVQQTRERMQRMHAQYPNLFPKWPESDKRTAREALNERLEQVRAAKRARKGLE